MTTTNRPQGQSPNVVSRKPLFFRKKNLIITATEPGILAVGTVEHCKSINAAKRKSVELQKAHGGLGRGSVQVIR